MRQVRRSEFSPSLKYDFHAGAFVNLRFGYKYQQSQGFFALQPEVLYSRQGFVADRVNIDFQYITALLMPRIYKKDLYLEVGPWISYLLDVNPNMIELDEKRIFISDLNGGLDAGVAIGVGYELSIRNNFGLIIGARYLFGLLDLANNLLWKNRVAAISLGLKF